MMHGDPLRLALWAESKRVGCRACIKHQRRVDGRGFECFDGRPVWPDGGLDSCAGWKRNMKHGEKNE
jgi:hypothetical protein